MSDPAFEAANRAMEQMINACGDPGQELGRVMYDLAVSAAREALKPVFNRDMDNSNDHRYRDQPTLVRLPYPDDTHNGLTNSPMMGWEPVRGLPYYIELVPKGSIEIEHDGKRLTPTNAAGAREIAAAFLSAAQEADEQ